LSELIADDEKRVLFGNRAHERALQFSPHRMAENYLAAYGKIFRAAQNHTPDDAIILEAAHT